ncbi:MAG: hypothetical protein WBB07_16510 [Mycobacterium sp.]
MIETVTGPMEPSELGFTLPHGQIFINLMPEHRGDGLLNDSELMVNELITYREAGGRSVVETTSGGLGRDPRGLKAVAATTKVSSCGPSSSGTVSPSRTRPAMWRWRSGGLRAVSFPASPPQAFPET